MAYSSSSDSGFSSRSPTPSKQQLQQSTQPETGTLQSSTGGEDSNDIQGNTSFMDNKGVKWVILIVLIPYTVYTKHFFAVRTVNNILHWHGIHAEGCGLYPLLFIMNINKIYFQTRAKYFLW